MERAMRCKIYNMLSGTLALLLILLGRVIAGDISFSERVIDSNLKSAFTVCVGDLDSDGDLDVIAGGQSGDIRIYINNGSGSFSKKYLESNYGAVWSVKVYDVNKDGKLDIIAAVSKAENITWYKNNGGLSFTKKIIDNNMVSAEDVAAGDLDGDGDIDLVGFAWNETTPTRWYENKGGGNFVTHSLDYSFKWAHFVEVADLDNDGDNDIVGTNGSGISWWRNNGSGSFSKRIIASNFSGAYCAQPADMNQDGKIDIIGAAHNINTVAWFKNTGGGNFSKNVLTDNFPDTHDAYAGDLDGDGDIDFVATSRALNGVAWFENNGNYRFTEHIISTNVNEAQTVILGDLDGDGDLDVVSEARRGDKVFWWKNESEPVEIIQKPDVPLGPTDGIVGEILSYTASGAVSNLNHSLEYQFDWGDGTTSDWGNGSETHTFNEVGTFQIKARARCASHTNRVSSWSDPLAVVVEEETVSTPDVPTGPDSGTEDEVLYFTASGALSNAGHEVDYQFDWGDGNLSSWGSNNRSHQYSSAGNYQIKTRARCSIHTWIVSNWSAAKNITINPKIFQISGIVKYYSNNQPVQNVTINFSGDINEQSITNAQGAYSLNVPRNSSVSLAAQKNANEDIGHLTISMYDAALAAQAALNMISLTENQIIAADADKNGLILTFDAALIAQNAVGLESSVSSHVREWEFSPSQIQINNIQQDFTDKNFEAIIIGDVDGGWSPNSLLKANLLGDENIFAVKERVIERQLFVDLLLKKEMELLSFDVELLYDSHYLIFDGVDESILQSQFNKFINPQKGNVRFGGFSIQPVKLEGKIISLIFSRKDNSSRYGSILLKKLQLNNQIIAIDRELAALESKLIASDYSLLQNFPNPFNSETKISFVLPERKTVKLVVFNIFGQQVAELYNGIKEKGIHTIIWNGVGQNGEKVAGGIYFYKLIVDGKQIETRKMALIE